MRSLGFDPLLPVTVILAVVGILVVTAVAQFRRGLTVRRRSVGARGARRAMVVLAVLAALDPTVDGGRAPVRLSDANVLFVVDTTGSMAAEDYDGGQPRLAGVRDDIVALAAAFLGAHFSLITFDSKTRVIVPWTIDRGALESAAGLLRQEWTFYAEGSRLDEALPAMRRAIPRRNPADSSAATGYSVVFYFSDGEQTASRAPRSFAFLGPDVDAGAVFGYGTSEGARMRVFAGGGEPPEQFIHDYATGADAVSRIDEGQLRTLADQLGVPYAHRTAAGGIGTLARSVIDEAGTVYAGERDTVRRLYWIPAFGLVAVALWLLARAVIEAVDVRRALSPPRGVAP